MALDLTFPAITKKLQLFYFVMSLGPNLDLVYQKDCSKASKSRTEHFQSRLFNFIFLTTSRQWRAFHDVLFIKTTKAAGGPLMNTKYFLLQDVLRDCTSIEPKPVVLDVI